MSKAPNKNESSNPPKAKKEVEAPSPQASITKRNYASFLRATNLPAMAETHHVMAFAPEHSGVTKDIIELEKRLSAEDNVHDLNHHLLFPQTGNSRDSLMSARQSFVIPEDEVKAIASRREELLKKSAMDTEAPEESFSATADHIVNPDEDIPPSKDFTHGLPAYDLVPRPYTKHKIDIEKRRAMKMIDVMNSTEEDFDFEETDKRVKFAPSGVLIFHVLELFNLSVNSTTFIRSLPVSFYCVLSTGIVRRCSKVVHSLTAKRIRMDFTAHFSLDLSEWRESPSNRFNMELWSFQDPESHFIVGTMDFHMYEFIRKTHAIEVHQLWSDGVKMGKVCVEYCFSYGYLGYGHSNQFKNPRNPIMETVSHSMYPRIKLDDRDELDKVYRARLPEKLKVFSYNSLILEMDKEFISAMSGTNITKNKNTRGVRVEDLEPKPMVLQQVRFENGKPVHCKLHMNIHQRVFQADLNDSYGEYVCIGGRKARLEYLNTYSQGRMRDVRETEAGALFLPLKEREPDKVIIADTNHPGFIIYPTNIPCHAKETNPQKFSTEDEQVFDAFPAVRREQGFLNVLFGYEKKPEPREFINDMEFPLYKESMKKWKGNRGCCRKCRWICLRIASFFNWLYNFILPEVRKQPLLPEISVTTASPEGSTTDLYTYFVRDQKEANLTKAEKLQSQVTNFMESVEAPLYDDSDDGDTLSSSEGDAEEKDVWDDGDDFQAPVSNPKRPST